MEMITDLRQRHLSAWTREIRNLKPEEMKSVAELPEVEFDEVTVKAAIKAGWFSDVDNPDKVDDMRGGDVNKLASEIWKAFNAARRIDPN
jgi:hypothetical protein